MRQPQGPVVGFVARSAKLMWGLFNQNPFSFAGDSDREDVNASILQPILTYSLPDKWPAEYALRVGAYGESPGP